MASSSACIGIDIDDVLADLIPAWVRRINVGEGTSFQPEDVKSWEFWDDFGLTKEKLFSYLTPDIYDSEVAPIEGAVQAVRDIHALVYSVRFVSSCYTESAYWAKMDWLSKYNLNPEFMIAVGPWAECKSKADVPDIDWLIDDHIGNLVDFPGYRVLVTRPHNRNLIWEGKRVKHLRDVIPLLKYGWESIASLVAKAEANEAAKKPESFLDMGPDDWTFSAATKPAKDTPLYPCHEGPERLWCDRSGGGDFMGHVCTTRATVRQFESGATRDVDTDKLDPEGFVSPIVMQRYYEFMHKNRYQRDGSMRASDNWTRGIPVDAYMKSLARHYHSVWLAHRTGKPLPQEEACAVLFNTMGLLFEDLKGQTPISSGSTD